LESVQPVFAHEPTPLGFEEIDACSPLTTLDNTKTLSFDSGNEVELVEQRDGSSTTVSGTWTYDQSNKRYVITIGPQTTSYVLLTSEALNICILAKGDAGSVDLTTSWFSRTYDEGRKE